MIEVRPHLVIFSLVILLLGCSQPSELIPGIPRVVTGNVYISRSGALFEGAVISESDESIIDHGFQWRRVGTEKIDYISAGPIKNWNFQIEVNFGIEENIYYEVRAYINTSNYKSFGEWVEFRGAGSKIPEIEEFMPMEGSWGDTISISGEYFSNKEGSVSVEFGDVPGEMVLTTDSLLKVIVPAEFTNAVQTSIKVKSGSGIGISKQQFSLHETEVIKVTPDKGGSGTVITVIGKYFNPSSIVKMDEVFIPVDQYFTDSLKITLPKEISPGTKSLTVISGPFSPKLTEAFNRSAPKLQSINPILGFFGDQVVLKGENFGAQYLDNEVLVNETLANIVEMKENELTVVIPLVVPSLLSEQELKFKIIADYVVTEFDQKLKIEEPLINGMLTDETIYPGQLLTINGNYFYPWIYAYPSPYLVKIDNIDVTPTSATSSQLDLKFPIPTANESSVQVGYFNNITSTSVESVKSPVVREADFPGSQRSRAASFTIGNKGYIVGGGSILGEYSGNETYEFDISTKTWRTVQDFPGEQRFGAASFALNGKGYILGGFKNGNIPLKDIWEYNSDNDSWTRKNDLEFHPLEAFVLNNKIYCLSDYTFALPVDHSEFWEYNPNIDVWTKKSPPSYNLKRDASIGLDYFTMQVDDILFAGINSPTPYIYQKYNPVTNTWEDGGSVDLVSGISPITFEYNGNGYLLTSGYLYEYNLNSNQWYLIEEDLSELLWYGGQPNKFRFDNRWYFTLFDYNGRMLSGPYMDYKNMMYEFDCLLID